MMKIAIRCAMLLVLCAGWVPSGLAAESADADFELTVQQGDTLIGLGKRWLANPARWPEVQRHNRIQDANRLVPGSTLAIPLPLLRVESADVTVRGLSGTASKADGTPITVGERLREGTGIRTGEDGHVTIQLVDGSTLRLGSRSDLTLARTQRVPGTGVTDSRFQLPSGRAEVRFKPSSQKGSRFEIQTGFASAAVRGTEFRVTAFDRATLTEVTEGVIRFAGTPPGAGQATPGAPVSVAQGFGSMVDESRNPLAPVRLLVAPALPQPQVIQFSPGLRFRFPPIASAAGYRAQLAADADFLRIVRENVSSEPEVNITNLEAGNYLLRVRAVDKLGLEGYDATVPVGILPAKPPAPAAPAAGQSKPLPAGGR